jgi:hypothetical protein
MVPADEVRTFTTTVYNSGGVTVKNVVVTNTLQTVQSSLVCTIGATVQTLPLSALAPGLAMVCRGNHAITAANIAANETVNIASVSATVLAANNPVTRGPLTSRAVYNALALQPSFSIASTPQNTYSTAG